MQWFYDELGRLKEDRFIHYVSPGAQDYRVTRSYRYDNLDRVVEHSNQNLLVPAGPHSTGPAMNQTYAYAYDADSLTMTREQFIGGQFAARTKSTYNAFDELVRQEDQEVSSASVASAILDFESTDAVFSYLGDGSLASITRYTDWDATLSGHHNRVETSYAYDGAGRLASIAHGQSRRTTATWPANTPLVDFDYAYDAAGRINSIGTDWNTGLAAFSSRTDETQSFTFDAAGQLKVVDSNLTNSDASYNYGANGNRLSATEPGSGTDSYLTGTSNQVSQDSTYNYSYDLEGNLTLRQSKSDATDYETYAWDHRNRLTKVERYFDAVLAETVAYRYNAADELVYRSFTSAGQTAQVVHFLVESGQRTMTFEQDGDVLHRYQYGPTGEALFDRAFSGYGAPTLQLETDLRLPVSDHQNSTRVVMGHSYLADHILYVRQSIDYDPFGRVREVVRENAPSPAPLPIDDLDTIFAHHGSIIDPDSELYLKGERWYSPDLGRFVSEDPIQDGSNWYAFAGNDPVNYADPSGLSQQGHPLAGGYSGNVTRRPTISSGRIPATSVVNPFATTTFGGFVDAAAGSSILGGGLAPHNFFGPKQAAIPALPPIAKSTPSRPASAASFDFTSSKNLSGIARTNASFPGTLPSVLPRFEGVVEGMRAQAFRDRMEDHRRTYGPGGPKDFRKNSRSFLDDSFNRDLVDVGSGITPGVSDARDLYEVGTGKDAITGQRLSWTAYGVTVGAALLPIAGAGIARKFFGVADTAHDIQRGVDLPTLDELTIDTYDNLGLRTDIPGQRHHLSQHAAYGSQIPYGQGMATKLEGNAITGVGSPHYITHEGLEAFWDQYRRGGSAHLFDTPTNTQYNRALYNSLQEAGLPPTHALRAVEAAKAQQLQHGLRGADPVPRIPGRLNQVPRR